MSSPTETNKPDTEETSKLNDKLITNYMRCGIKLILVSSKLNFNRVILYYNK